MSEPHYWNRANFEGLASLSSALRGDPRLEPLALYYELREKGLRRHAFAELETFLERASDWDEPIRRDVALRVLDAHWRTPQGHQFLAEPLRKGFIEPVLEDWRAAEPDNSLPLRHLGLLRRDRDLLDRALRINPEDDHVRAALAGILIGFVDYATHHLVEGKFIGDEEESSAALMEAAAILEAVSDSASVRSLNEDIQNLRTLLADWREYRKAPSGTFPEWCRERNRHHRWWSILYYDDGDA